MTTVTPSNNPNFRYEVIQPFSENGKIANNLAALPSLGASAHGRLMGVGGSNLHIVYRYSFDEKSQTDKWTFLYMEKNGIAV